jgi:hypothetical protein
MSDFNRLLRASKLFGWRLRHFGWLSPAAKERYARVRGLLRAGEAVLRLPDKEPVCCPGCGGVMKFLLALRPRARPPPESPSALIRA